MTLSPPDEEERLAPPARTQTTSLVHSRSNLTSRCLLDTAALTDDDVLDLTHRLDPPCSASGHVTYASVQEAASHPPPAADTRLEQQLEFFVT